MGKHFGQAILENALKMRNEGLSHREIGEHFDLTTKQVKQLLERYRRKERNKVAGKLSRPKGRPRKKLQNEEERLLLENKQLKMENELLRAFHHAIGRR